MEITIKDLYENIDTLPKSLYREVNNYIKFLKSQHKDQSKFEAPKWQMDETRRRAKYADENPNSLLNFDEFMDEFEKKILSEK